MAPAKPRTAAAASPRPGSPRAARKPATTTSAAAERSSTSKSLPRSISRRENIPPVSALNSAKSTYFRIPALSDATEPKQLKRYTRSGAPLSKSATPQATPERRLAAISERTLSTPEAQTPGSSQVGERQSSRKRKKTPRAIESWALNSNKKTKRSESTYITRDEAEAEKARIANRPVDNLYFNGFKPQTTSEEEDEVEAVAEYQRKKRNSTEGALFRPSDLVHPEFLTMDEGGLKMQGVVGRERKTLKRPTQRREFVLREVESKGYAVRGEESEAILYEIKSTPESAQKRKAKVDALKAVESVETVEKRVENDLSPSKRAGNKKMKADEMTEMTEMEVRGSMSRMSVEQSEVEDADEEKDDEDVRKKETHAEMLKRLEKTRAKKTYGGKKRGRKPNSLANLINSHASTTQKAGLAKASKVDNQSDADDSDSPINAPPSKSTISQPRRTSRRTEVIADSKFTKTTRASAEPHLKGAHLDANGENLEYETCPYYFHEVNQGHVTYPIAYDEVNTTHWSKLRPTRVKIIEDGRHKYITGQDTVEIDRSKTKLHSLPDTGKEEDALFALPDVRRRKSSRAGEKEEQEEKTKHFQPAKIIDARKGEDGKVYMMISWYWTRKEVANDLKGFAGYLNRRWPKEKPWTWMLCAEFDVVCADAIVRRIKNVVVEGDVVRDGGRDERFCSEMVYGGCGLNFEIFGREVGLDGYNLDGIGLNEEDRKTFKGFEDKKPKGERKTRGEVEEGLREWFGYLWPTKEAMAKHRAEVVAVDGCEEETWGDEADDYGKAYIPKSEGGTGRLLPKSKGGEMQDPEENEDEDGEEEGEGAMDIDD